MGWFEGVAIDGGGGGIHPEAGRVGEARDDLAEQAGGEDAGVVDLGAVAEVVAAVDAAAGEVDADVCAFRGFRSMCLR